MLDESDFVLAQRAASGDLLARDQLVRRHYAAIDRLCRRLCPDAFNSDDVRQETLLAVLRNLGSYRGDASFTTWAFTVARTHNGRALRTNKRHRARADRLAQHLVALPQTAEQHDDALAAAELRSKVRRALERLPALERAVLESRDFMGCSAAETASALGLTVPAVKTRLHRARSRMRVLLAEPAVATAAA